jgi:hypothetical protein
MVFTGDLLTIESLYTAPSNQPMKPKAPLRNKFSVIATTLCRWLISFSLDGLTQRVKTEVKPMDKASEAILAFQPVTFHYKTKVNGRPQFGLIAEEVEKVRLGLSVTIRV